MTTVASHAMRSADGLAAQHAAEVDLLNLGRCSTLLLLLLLLLPVVVADIQQVCLAQHRPEVESALWQVLRYHRKRPYHAVRFRRVSVTSHKNRQYFRKKADS